MNFQKTVLAVTLLLLSSCITMKPVQFLRTENFSVSSNNNSPVVSFGLVFYNPNSFGCTVAGIESEGSMDKKLIFNAGFSTKVKASRKKEFTFPVSAVLARMDLKQLLGTGINLLLNDEIIPMQVKGKVRIRKFIFSKTYDFEYTQRIDKAWLMKLF